MNVDLRDAHAYGGILLASLGAGAIEWQMGLVVLGGALTYIGLFHRGR